MAPPPSNSLSEPAIMEQVITEFFAKSLHIILESRSPYVSSRNYSADLFTSSPSSSSSTSNGRPRDKWFNLALSDCPAALENFDLWRQSNLEPLVVDVILVRRKSKETPLNSWSSGHDEFLPDNKSEKIVERWVVQYESRKSNNIPRELHSSGKRSGSSGGGSSNSSEIPSMYKKTYKRTIILLRSLYVTVRLLPAFKVFRDLNSSGQISAFSLSHKICSFVQPFIRAEDAEMNLFSFVPVDTPCGRLSLSVSYLPTLEDVSSELSTPMSTQFILDYVGSPTADPLKRLHSLPSAGSLPTYISFTRRHSWSNDHGAPSISSSPSPTYSDSHAVNYTPSPRLPPRSHPLDPSPSTCPASHNPLSLAHKKNTSFDEYWPSPPCSPSSSPSPPTHLPGAHLRNSPLRSESAPVSIPFPRPGVNSGLISQALPPSPSLKSGKAGCSSQADLLRAQMATASASQTSSPESKLQLKKGSDDLHTGMTLQKILYSGKDAVGNLSGWKLSSCSSPRRSRSSSRFSFLDEFDDPEFACPFAGDDEDLTGSCRAESGDADVHTGEDLVSGQLIPVRRSPDAAVGALVRMLKTAAPLRQDLPNSVTYSQAVKQEVWNQGIPHYKDKEVGVEESGCVSGSMITASGLFKSRTAVDALEELKSYKKTKELLLLRQGSPQSLDVAQAEDVEQAENFASGGSSEI